MKVIKLPIKVFNGNTEEAEKYQDLGLEVEDELIDVTLTVVIDNIVAWNEDSQGDTTLYLAGDPIPYKIEVTIEKFEKMLKHACKYGEG